MAYMPKRSTLIAQIMLLFNPIPLANIQSVCLPNYIVFFLLLKSQTLKVILLFILQENIKNIE